MTDAITVRFDEWYRYDPQIDAEVIRVLAITGKGTYHSEFPRGTSGQDRARKKVFREYVMHAMSYNIEPHEVNLEEATVA